MSDFGDFDPAQHLTFDSAQRAHLLGEAVALARDWLAAVFDESDLGRAWRLTDEPLRLAMVQSWIVLEDERVTEGDRDEVAEALSAERHDHPLWLEFAGWRLVRWRAVLPPYVVDSTTRGVVTLPMPVGVDLEAVGIASVPSSWPHLLPAAGPIEVFRILVRYTPAGARVAGLAGALPHPGWPPSETSVPM